MGFLNISYSKYGVLAIGVFNIIIGISGLLLFIILSPQEIHSMLQPEPFQGKPQQLQRSLDIVGDTVQFLIEYWFPSLSILVLGLVLVLASLTKNNVLVIFSFVLSTIHVAGSLAGVACLLMTRSNWIGVLPFAVITAIEFYFYWIIIEFSRYTWDIKKSDDKEILVDSKL